MKRIEFLSVVALLLVASAVLADNILLPKGTALPARLETALSSKLSQVGDTVKAGYTGDSSGGFPTGTIFVGRITEVSAKTKKEPGKVTVLFTQAVLPSGKRIAIQGVPGIDKSSNTNNPNKKKAVGKGAVIGAVGGMLLFHNNVAGALVGGATGAGVGALTAKKPTDLEIKSGTPCSVILMQTATIPASR